MVGLAIKASQLELCLAVACTGRLTQQLETDTAVALTIALAAQQTPQTTLRFHHALTRRLLEQAPRNPLDTLISAQVLAIEQPQRHAQRQPCRRGGSGKGGGGGCTRSHAHLGAG